MSIYDQRESPAYVADWSPYHNRNIAKWWSERHDQLITKLIEKYQWHWYWEISDAILEITPKEIMDTLSQQYAWYNKVMKFAATRANELGLTNNIRKPRQKTCPLCNNTFVEDSLPHAFVKRLGIGQLDFCPPCLRDTVLRETGRQDASKAEVIDYLRKLTSILGRVPPQGFGEGMEDLLDIKYEQRLELLRLFRKKPTVKRVKAHFGSWLKALIEAGILESETRETPRGIQTLSQDGHICYSLGEKTIDDYLNRQGVGHQRDPKYPDRNYRADFLVGDIFIEYFGLAGDPDYDKKTKEKQKICQKHGIKLIGIYPKDLVSSSKLEKKLSQLE